MQLRIGWVYPGLLARAMADCDLTAEVQSCRVFIRDADTPDSAGAVGKVGVLLVTQKVKGRDALFDGQLVRLAQDKDLWRLPAAGMPVEQFDSTLAVVASEPRYTPKNQIEVPSPLSNRFTVTFIGTQDGLPFGELNGFRVVPDTRRWICPMPQIAEEHTVDLVELHLDSRWIAYVEPADGPAPRGPIVSASRLRDRGRGRRQRLRWLPARFAMRFTDRRGGHAHALIAGIHVYSDEGGWEAQAAEIGPEYIVEIVYQGNGLAFVKRASDIS